MSVVYGLWWTVFFLLVVVAATLGVEGAVALAGAIARVVGWLLGATYGVLMHDA